MASETEVHELSSVGERLLAQRDLSLFLPFILGFTYSQNQNQNQNQDPTENGRIILVNPITQGMVVIEGNSSLESLLRELDAKKGQPPASRTSIEAMPSVEITEIDGECVICLEEWEIGGGGGGVVKEMPCKHRFHGDCIEKWLSIHGSCPVCRYNMPTEEVRGAKREDGEERRRFDREREIWFSFSFDRNRSGISSNGDGVDSETSITHHQSSAQDT